MQWMYGIVVASTALTLAGAAPVAGQQEAPALHLRAPTEELLRVAYPQRYQGDPEALLEDVEWVRDEGEDLLEWWDRQGEMYLLRASDLAGLPWPYRDIEVYLVR